MDLIDAVRVGDPTDLPLGSEDPAILRWAEREQRILIPFDKSSMAKHLSEHFAGGNHCPGIFMVATESKPVQVLVVICFNRSGTNPSSP